jgi:hypothetical protein
MEKQKTKDHISNSKALITMVVPDTILYFYDKITRIMSMKESRESNY